MKGIIYALCEPGTEVIRYVGKTINLEQRYREHCKKNNGTLKSKWVSSLSEKPGVIVLDEVGIEILHQTETYWIHQCKAWGFDLVNTFVNNKSNSIDYDLLKDFYSYDKTTKEFKRYKSHKAFVKDNEFKHKSVIVNLISDNTIKTFNNLFLGRTKEDCLIKEKLFNENQKLSKQKTAETCKTKFGRKLIAMNIKDNTEILNFVSIAECAKHLQVTDKEVSGYLNGISKNKFSLKGYVIGDDIKDVTSKYINYIEYNKAKNEKIKNLKAGSKKILCETTNVIYSSIKEASEQMNLCRRGISKACGKTEYKGYSFKYV
jgi:hypothetical protein